MTPYRAIEWKNDRLILLDQRLLPHQTVYVTLRDAAGVAEAIQNMTIRGAPAIGAAAAYGLALEAVKPWPDARTMQEGLKVSGTALIAARPTAINLAWAVNRVLAVNQNPVITTPELLREKIVAEADAIANQEIANNIQIGLNALELWPQEVTFLHHCNTGALATVDYGTALGVIRAAHDHGKKVFVYVDETRPRLQGARLTAWELGQLGISHEIISDGAAGHFLRRGQVAAVFVGADRVATNGDVANKIGTYMLALAAHDNQVPFYAVLPTSTIDLSLSSGEQIPIEERDPAEVLGLQQDGFAIAPAGSRARNPAFDVTPNRLVSAIVTEVGILRPPYSTSLSSAAAEAQG